MTKHTDHPSAAAALIEFQHGLQAHQNGQLSIAQHHYAQALALHPHQFEALHLSGVLAYQTGQLEQSVKLIESALAIQTQDAAAHSNYGNTLLALQRNTEALAAYERALQLQPHDANTHFNRGNTLHALGRFTDAIHAFDDALKLNPKDAEAHYNRGNSLRQLQRYAEALQSYNESIAIRPEYAPAAINRGITLLDLKRPEEAIESFKFAILIEPNSHEAYLNYGNTLRAIDRPDEALDCYAKAIARNPNYAEAYNNQGSTLEALKRYNEALASFSKAIAIQPQLASAHWNRALCNLRIGNFKEGWIEYEWRWKLDQFTSPQRNFSQPLWLGVESLTDKTIVIHSEQGFGDTILFCRYVPVVKQLGAHVVLEVEASLVELMQTLTGADQIIAKNTPLPAFHYHCPLLSLPLALGATINNIPNIYPYLSSTHEKTALWDRTLRPTTRKRIGIIWKGRPTHANDRKRSINLADLIALLPEAYEYISLQKDLNFEDIMTLTENPNIQNIGQSINSFADTAAVCQFMDAIISVDTSVAHLSSALNIPTGILLPENPDWRWGLDDHKTYWYQTTRLIRNNKINKAELNQYLSSLFSI